MAEFGAEPAAHLWAREATLAYFSARRPTDSPLKQLQDGQPVESYYL